MELLDARNTIIAWKPNSDAIKAGNLLYGNDEDWTRRYEMTSCAAHVWVRSATDEIISSFLKSEFIACVFRDGVCPKDAYHEFMRVRQFQDCVPEDMPVDPVLFYTLWDPFEDNSDYTLSTGDVCLLAGGISSAVLMSLISRLGFPKWKEIHGVRRWRKTEVMDWLGQSGARVRLT